MLQSKLYYKIQSQSNKENKSTRNPAISGKKTYTNIKEKTFVFVRFTVIKIRNGMPLHLRRTYWRPLLIIVGYSRRIRHVHSSKRTTHSVHGISCHCLIIMKLILKKHLIFLNAMDASKFRNGIAYEVQ